MALGELPQEKQEKASGRSVSSEGFLTFEPALGGVLPAVSAEEALGMAQFALDQAADAVQWISPEGRFLYVNEESCRALGYSREELLAMGVWDIDPDRTAEVFQERFQMLKKQKTWTFETRHRRKDGTIFPVEVAARYGTSGGQEYYFAFVRDISERREAQERLLASEQKYRELYQNLRDGWAQVDVQGRIVQSNEAFRQLTGYTEEELARLTYEDLTPERWHATERTILTEQVFARGYSDLYEKEYCRKDGSVVPIEVQTYRVPHEAFPSSWALVRNITERKRAEDEVRVSEERWQFALEGAGDGIWDWNAHTNEVFFSRQWKAMLGFEEHEIGNSLEEWDTRVHPEDKKRVYAEMEKHFSGEAPVYVSEHRVKCKDRTYKWILDRGRVISRTGDGKPLRVVGTHTDLTERKRAEEALRESEERFRSIVEHSHAGIYMIDDAFRFVYVNDLFCKITGYAREEIVGTDFRSILAEASVGVVCDHYLRRQRGEEIPDQYQITIIRKDGEKRIAEMAVSVITDAAGHKRTVGQGLDITERKRAEAELAAMQQRLIDIIEFLPDATFVIDKERKVIAWNKALEELTGSRKEDLLGRGAYAYALPLYGKKRPMLVDLYFEPDANIKGEYTLLENRGATIVGEGFIPRARQGKGIYFWGVASPLFDAQGNTVGAIESVRDITERKQAEEALRDQYKFLEVLLESVPLPVFFKDKKETYLGCNKAFETLLGTPKSQIIGRKVHELTRGVLADVHHRGDRYVFDHPGIHAYEYDLVDSKMKRRHFVITKATYQDQEGNVAGLIGTVFETTEIKRLQAQLLQAQKMEAVGTLSAGVAHEINNPITGVINYAQILCDQAEERGADAGILLRIITEAERVSKIVRSLLSFARESSAEVGFVDIGPIIEDTLALTTAQFRKEGIQVLVEVRKGLPPIMANRQQIQQVVLNILANSRYALNKKYGGFDKNKLIEIRAELMGTNGAKVLRTAFYDRGTGIPRELQSEIFNPFFSTKPVNEGTGLGLSISYGIVKDHQGNIQVESVEGEYTKMMVDFPVATPSREDATA